MMTQHAKIGAALVGGYLLGRTKKAKLAVGFGMFLLGKRIDLDPRQIGRALADSPALGSLNAQVRKDLVDATRTAATKAVTQRAGSLADSLQQRTRALETGPEEEDDEYEPEPEPEQAEAEPEEREPAPRKTAAKSGPKAAAKSRSSSGAGKSGSRSGGTSKSSAPARKRTGAARRTAASGARKARGGDDA